MALHTRTKPTEFGPPQISPGLVQDPAVQRYLQARLAQQEPLSHSQPVAGGPAPAIPPLGQHATQAGLSMADYARRGVVAPPEPLPSPNLPFTAPRPETPLQALTQGILQNDFLPEAAKSDPAYRSGMGSDLAINQPALAHRYGVIRNGQLLAPQQLSTGRPGLREETVRGLEALAQAQKQQAAEQTDAKEVQEALPDKKREEEDKKAAVEALDEFDLMRLREVMNDTLSNEDQRKIVEARCKPLEIDGLIMQGFTTQEVPIVVDPKTGAAKFAPMFRSTNGQENLALKMLLMKEAKSLDLRGAYFDEKFALMGACAATVAINGRPLADHLDSEGNFDEKLFWAKFNRFIRFSIHMLGSLGVHAYWFDQRVRRLFRAEEVKNG